MTNLIDLVQLPWLLVLAVALPVMFALLLRRARAERARRLQRLGSLDLVRRLVPASVFSAGGWRAVRLASAAALAGVAIAGPQWGLERSTVRSTGVDLVLAVDASLSMMATDERPNRLERVKQEIRRLRALSPGDRVGLLAFAGRSYVLSPITVDGGALDLFLDNLDPSIVGQAGSSIAQAITQGTSLLALTKSGADRALVIMSDGEAFEPQDELLAASRRAKEQGVSLVTVGFGTAQGSTIPVKEGGRVSEKRDEKGVVVVTHYRPDLLQAAAAAATGTFIPAEATDKAARIKSALARLRTKSRATLGGEDRTPRYQWFLLPAVLLLWLDTVLAGRRGRRRRREAAAETAVAASLAFLFVTGCGGSQEAVDGTAAYRAKNYVHAAALFAQVIKAGDASPGALYNYGTALLAADSMAAAAEILDRSAEKADPEVRFRARFNAGLSHLIRGLGAPTDSAKQASTGASPASPDSAKQELTLALASYKRVLIQRPADADAKWNYELALEKKKKQSGGGGGGGGGQSSASPAPAKDEPKPQPTLAQRQAEQLLGSAEREEREVQSKKQQQNRPEPPPGGKDW
ncbi:MAG: von Willebrand factor type [Gemmatimonadetes bacterium]|nr:von Willebrand factor type [Gemmatimonadota bacterium]